MTISDDDHTTCNIVGHRRNQNKWPMKNERIPISTFNGTLPLNQHVILAATHLHCSIKDEIMAQRVQNPQKITPKIPMV